MTDKELRKQLEDVLRTNEALTKDKDRMEVAARSLQDEHKATQIWLNQTRQLLKEQAETCARIPNVLKNSNKVMEKKYTEEVEAANKFHREAVDLREEFSSMKSLCGGADMLTELKACQQWRQKATSYETRLQQLRDEQHAAKVALHTAEQDMLTQNANTAELVRLLQIAAQDWIHPAPWRTDLSDPEKAAAEYKKSCKILKPKLREIQEEFMDAKNEVAALKEEVLERRKEVDDLQRLLGLCCEERHKHKALIKEQAECFDELRMKLEELLLSGSVSKEDAEDLLSGGKTVKMRKELDKTKAELQWYRKVRLARLMEKAWVVETEEPIVKLGIGFRALPPAPLLITKVEEDSWADEAGIMPNDELLEVNGVSVLDITPKNFDSVIMKRPLRFKIRNRCERARLTPDDKGKRRSRSAPSRLHPALKFDSRIKDALAKHAKESVVSTQSATQPKAKETEIRKSTRSRVSFLPAPKVVERPDEQEQMPELMKETKIAADAAKELTSEASADTIAPPDSDNKELITQGSEDTLSPPDAVRAVATVDDAEDKDGAKVQQELSDAVQKEPTMETPADDAPPDAVTKEPSLPQPDTQAKEPSLPQPDTQAKEPADSPPAVTASPSLRTKAKKGKKKMLQWEEEEEDDEEGDDDEDEDSDEEEESDEEETETKPSSGAAKEK